MATKGYLRGIEMHNNYIFVVKPSHSAKPGDIVFYDQDGFRAWALEEGRLLVNYRFGYIDPAESELYIKQLDYDTIRALI